MSYRVEITGGPFSRERQAELVRLLVPTVGIEPEEAELNVLLAPCTVGPVDAGTRDRLLDALGAAGFEATATGAAPVYTNEPAYAEPAYAEPAYAPPPAPAYAPPTPPYESPAYEPPAPAYAETVAEPARSNGMLIAVAAVLGLLVVGLGVTALLANRGDAPDPVVVDAGTPGYGGSEPTPTTTIDDDLVDGSMVEGSVVEEPTSAGSSDAAEYALGYSPRRGVNWDVFVSADRVRTAAVPDGTPIPIRDAPSGRHGDAIAEVAYGNQVRTTGCLARRDDGGRWCQVSGDQGWIYDRYLQSGSAPPRSAPTRTASSGVQTSRTRDGQFTMSVSEGGRTWRLPRPLSAGTSVSGITQRSLAGRDVVEFTARDARWTTTYYWEYRAGLLHFVGESGGRTNVSEFPTSRAIIAADLGYVPGDDIVTGGGSSSNGGSSSSSAVPTQALVVMGSYRLGDDAGLRARVAQAQLSGVALETGPSENYGMSPGYIVIVSGPYERAQADRVLARVKPHVLDAFLRTIR